MKFRLTLAPFNVSVLKQMYAQFKEAGRIYSAGEDRESSRYTLEQHCRGETPDDRAIDMWQQVISDRLTEEERNAKAIYEELASATTDSARAMTDYLAWSLTNVVWYLKTQGLDNETIVKSECCTKSLAAFLQGHDPISQHSTLPFDVQILGNRYAVRFGERLFDESTFNSHIIETIVAVPEGSSWLAERHLRQAKRRYWDRVIPQ